MVHHPHQQEADALRAEIEAEEKRLEAEQKLLAEKRELLAVREMAKRHGYDLVKIAPTPVSIESLTPWAKPTWNQTMLRVLNDAGGYLPHHALYEGILKSPVYSALTPGYRNFHGALERLKKRKEIVSYNGVVYTTKIFDDMKAQGALIPKIKRLKAPMTTRQFITELLKAHPEGLAMESIADAMEKCPDVPKRFQVADSKRFTKEALAAAVRLGRVVCKDGIYKLPAKIGPLKRMKGARFDGKPSRSTKAQSRSEETVKPKKAKGRTLSGRPTPQVATIKSGQDPDLSGLH